MKKTILILISTLLLILPPSSVAEVRSGSYSPPTTRADNSELLPEEIAGFNVYIDGQVIVNPDQKYTLKGDATTFSVDILPGSHVVTITTHDTEGRSSSASAAITVTAKSPPNSPVLNVKTSITIIINN